MRIAISGGTGFLGKYVAEYLEQKNQIPVILTRREIDTKVEKYEYRITDYSRSNLIEKLEGIDAIVHLAAMRGSQGNISEFHEGEVITQNLYDACHELNIRNIVYASTISVYSDAKSLPWSEGQVPAPKLMYGVSKMTCEHIGNIYSSKKGLNIKNLRFAHLYGFNEKNNYMINRFFRQAFNGEQLTLDTNSVSKREFLYAKDAAKAIYCALKKINVSGTFNIGSGEYMTNYEVAKTINNEFKNKDNLTIKSPEAEETIESSYMDNNMAKVYLDFSPEYTFVDATKEIYMLMKELGYVPLFY